MAYPEGEKSSRAKLSQAHVELLREQYFQHRNGRWNRSGHGQHNPFSILALANEYDMSPSAMYYAIKGISYKGKP